ARMGARWGRVPRRNARLEVLLLPHADPGRVLSLGTAADALASARTAVATAHPGGLRPLRLRELVAVLAQHLGIREDLHHRATDGARIALLHGARLSQPSRVRPPWNAAL